jgi:glycosyltransferase involved in cell wall biosynthesis
VDFRWYHRFPPVLQSYYAVADRIGDFSVSRMKANLTLTNSHWTATLIRQFLGVEARVLYPPVVAAPHPQRWEDRRSHFLAVGRVSPEKDYERLIAILSRVRASGHDVTLTIVGTWDRNVRRYLARLRRLARTSGSWVRFAQNVSRQELQELMATHRYGIHGMREEHFGMAPAEMVASGMIVWVPAGGGQTEIVGSEERLLFASDEEAAARIIDVLGHESEQRRLQAYLRERAHLFGTDRFVDEIRRIVDDWPGVPAEARDPMCEGG